MRLHVIARGNVARRSITPNGPVAERVVLRDCKRVSVANDKLPPSPSAVSASPSS